MTALSFPLSLGSTLYVGGHDTHVPMPYRRPGAPAFAPGSGPAALRALHEPLRRGSRGVRTRRGPSTMGKRPHLGGRCRSTATADHGSARRRGRGRRHRLACAPAERRAGGPSRVAPFFSSSAARQDPGRKRGPGIPVPERPRLSRCLRLFLLAALPGHQRPAARPGRGRASLQADRELRLATGRIHGNTAGPSPLAPASVEAFFDYEFYGVTTSPGKSHLLVTSQSGRRSPGLPPPARCGHGGRTARGPTPGAVDALLTSAIGRAVTRWVAQQSGSTSRDDWRP